MDRVSEVRFRRRSLLTNHFRLVILGGSGSGKTLFLLSLFETLVAVYRHIFLFTPIINPAYNSYVWPDHVHKVTSAEELEYSLSTVRKDLSRYIESSEHGTGDKGDIKTRTRPRSHRRHKFLVILDDVGDLQLRSKTLVSLMNYGRHLNISVAMLCQTYKHVPANCRASITHLCCCNVSDTDVENMLRSMSVGGSKKLLLQALSVMKSASHDTRRIYIIEDSVFSEGEQRICYDAANRDVVEQKTDISILLGQFSHMRDKLAEILECRNRRQVPATGDSQQAPCAKDKN
ncbi:ATPase/DNA packaging protein [Eastern grey kangaroopox virus]|uniref:DNA packaging protein OPG160 n=1 Tax=Eastern grey kangaroopox virus TaxID=2042482 RepID=A0A2C9DTA4_9POXV|nr:ATPase/DNA packaging protein [Eastern grey kangaroopox virus]ATI21237.1 ATPase/DNA packaging protein [Eastern grey kangaroopox virus]ATX75143.1 ATPase/DNA packaging protein [Eastern grey kangaroopox virus]